MCAGAEGEVVLTPKDLDGPKVRSPVILRSPLELNTIAVVPVLLLKSQNEPPASVF